jgi:predicted  nucleic acid-binding Zn-ribbon protein
MSGRETEHMRLEVQSLRGQQGALEEKVLRLLEDVDPVREKVSSIQADLDMLDSKKGELEYAIKKQWKKIDAELARKEERKGEALSPIDPELLDLYEKLREIKEGVAVASYDHGVCGGCHMALSPAEQDEAFGSELPRCVHCRRILVA